jgi:hypothetical protein
VKKITVVYEVSEHETNANITAFLRLSSAWKAVHWNWGEGVSFVQPPYEEVL